MTPDGLDDLRARIAEVDGEILDLVARRLALAREVGEAKRAAGLPVRSYSTEAEVLARYRRRAAALGVDTGLAERLAHHLIGAAVRRQEEALPGTAEASQRILLVGGAGQMGRWLAQFFLGQGHHVAIADPAGGVPGCERAGDLAAGVEGADVVLLATPLSSGPGSLREVLALEPKALVADIFSLKSHVVDDLRGAASRGLHVASLHPLFGPAVTTLGGRVLAVLDCGDAAAADEAAALFRDTALTITRLPVEDHDAYMQYVLGLSHLVAILFFTTLTESGRGFDELARMASTTFFRQVRSAGEVARENPRLYYDIQKLNRHSHELFALVRRSLESIERAALAETPDGFAALLERGRAYFPGEPPVELE